MTVAAVFDVFRQTFRSALGAACLAVFVLSGCANAPGPLYANAPIPALKSDMARVYVLRDDAGGSRAAVLIGDVHLFGLGGSAFAYQDVPPGEVTVHLDVGPTRPDGALRLGVNAGETHYVLVSTVGGVRLSGGISIGNVSVTVNQSAPFRFQEISEAEALRRLPGLRQVK